MKNQPYNLSAAILAGGNAVRFGGADKAFLEINGRSIISRMLAVLRPLFAQIIVVTPQPDRYRELAPLVCIQDIYEDWGPLGGIHAGLSVSTQPAVFAFACDLPFLQQSFLRRQIATFYESRSDILLPRFDGKIEPLHAIYSRSIEPALRRHFASATDKKTRSFFPKVHTRYMEVDGDKAAMRSFVNINTPKDLDIFCKSLYIG